MGLPLFTGKYDGVKWRIKEVPTLDLVGVTAEPLESKEVAPDFLVFSMPFLLRSLRQEESAGENATYYRTNAPADRLYRIGSHENVRTAGA